VDDLLEKERERLDALLGMSGVEFTQDESGEGAAPPGAAASWRFRSPGVAEVEVHVCMDHDATQEALHALLASVGPPDDWGLPSVGQNGRLVYAVHHRGGADEAALFRTLGVAGALGGEEE
jgi:hypothetical protein